MSDDLPDPDLTPERERVRRFLLDYANLCRRHGYQLVGSAVEAHLAVRALPDDRVPEHALKLIQSCHDAPYIIPQHSGLVGRVEEGMLRDADTVDLFRGVVGQVLAQVQQERPDLDLMPARTAAALNFGKCSAGLVQAAEGEAEYCDVRGAQ